MTWNLIEAILGFIEMLIGIHEKDFLFVTLSKQVWSEEEISTINLCLHINWGHSHLAN